MIFYENKSKNLYCGKNSNLNFPPHLHKELEIVAIEEGELEIMINSNVHILRKGDVSLIFPNTIHSYKTESSNTFLLMIINPVLLPLYTNTFASYRPEKMYLEGAVIPQEVYDSLNGIHEEIQAENSLGILTGYLYIAVTRMLSLLTLEKKRKHADFSVIERVLSYISDNYQNQISLFYIADQLDISPFYISRVFSSYMGIRLDNYINELRVNYASYQLRATDKRITEIALESGFETLRTFNRAFRSVTAQTPREYRQCVSV